MRGLRDLCKLYLRLEKARVSFQQFASVHPDLKEAQEVLDRVAAMEEQVFTECYRMVEDLPIMAWLEDIKGIGPKLSVKVLGLIEDINMFPNVSKLWRYAGLAVIDGKAERRTKGKKVHYNPDFKSLMYVVGTSLIKASGKYKRYYDQQKEYYINREWATLACNKECKSCKSRCDWPKMRIHLTALRKTAKLFLAHLWETWMSLERTNDKRAYAFDVLGHTDYIHPEEMLY